MNNYMKQVAQMLGVEIDEEFLISLGYDKYKLTKNGLVYYDDHYNKWLPSCCLEYLLNGKYKIKNYQSRY